MFNLLSNQKKLLKLVSNYTEQEFGIVCTNLKLMIELLSISTSDLLANRRTYGLLLPSADAGSKKLSSEKPSIKINAQLLLEQNNLISAINSLCLTEAIMVRNNFTNCLELLNEKNDGDKKTKDVEQKTVIKTTPEKSTERVVIVNEKSNVSPIRLTEIKQRLAQAVQVSAAKQDSIKNHLNNLLDKPTATLSKISSKQA
ncbi:hypothetical protein CXF85_00455 [Colwellia sp. 75C3]|uniref:hypothetical protein n=1 Tax=Colwellia sp. 75C3 TaxID=888425 RepID=UPI000C329B05|nr:hypothetical protein [Colwellia sp. 75C3]PKG86223.1 hypothetical protein CXF85_00455 [Colwellia sp. 75C3]